MKLYSTNNTEVLFSLKEAVLKGLPDDNGLFIPQTITPLPASFFESIHKYSFPELSFEVAKALIGSAVPENDLKEIVFDSINFAAPVVPLDDHRAVLELFHGPTLAFKDFGARFMARLMAYFNKGERKELVILVATSGDTGGAVASGFYKTPGIEVVILYPSGRVSPLQEKQLTTLGHNISALEVDGSFDDCQAMVKSAFLDRDLNKSIRLSSANSINIARLIPQTFYYFEAYKQLKDKSRPLVFSIPSGNFGNLTAGLLAKRLGLPVEHFIAATNSNDIVPQFLSSGEYTPKASVATISNAMDVGNPSNFYRMLSLYMDKAAPVKVERFTWNNMKKDISGFAYSDEATREAIQEVMDKYNYTMDPHGAVGYLALKEYQASHPNTSGIILETAHPSKFIDEVESTLNINVEIPARLAILADQPKEATPMKAQFDLLKSFLLERF